MKITAPEPITDEHVTAPFDCGVDVLSEWLRLRAMKNQLLNASRTFVTCLEGTKRVVGYYSLAMGSVAHTELGRPLRQNMPDPVPVILLGRLAVDVCTQGNKYGKWLLKDAMLRIERLSHEVAIKAVMVHAISDDARAFYEHLGFVQSPVAPNTLFYKL